MAQKEDTKTSRANKQLQLWPSHFAGYCSFWTTMSDSDLQAFQGATSKDLEKLVVKDWQRRGRLSSVRRPSSVGP